MQYIDFSGCNLLVFYYQATLLARTTVFLCDLCEEMLDWDLTDRNAQSTDDSLCQL